MTFAPGADAPDKFHVIDPVTPKTLAMKDLLWRCLDMTSMAA